MRFMRFSKDSLLVRFAALALVGALGLFGVFASPGEANAGKFVYTVKFNCQFKAATEIAFGSNFGSITENSVINIHNPNNETVRFNKKVVLAVRNAEYGQFKNDHKGQNVSKLFGEQLLPNDAVFVDCNEILTGFNFFDSYFNNSSGLDADLNDLMRFHMPFPIEFLEYIDELQTIEEGISLDGVAVIETRRLRGKRRDVVVSAKYWKTFFDFDGKDSAGVSIHVENNIQPVVTSGKFQLGPPPPNVDINFPL